MLKPKPSNRFKKNYILPDWLLIYKVDGINLLLYLERTGTHSDLF